jgi:hypothetical protein
MNIGEKYKLTQVVSTAIFSHNQKREMISLPLSSSDRFELCNIQTTVWGETILSFKDFPPLIGKTYFGLTPFMLALELIL